MVHMHNKVLAIKKKEQCNAICSSLDGARDCHADSHTERQMYITYVWDLKRSTNQLVYKAEVESQMEKTNIRLPRNKGVRSKLGNWDGHMYITICKIDK